MRDGGPGQAQGVKHLAVILLPSMLRLTVVLALGRQQLANSLVLLRFRKLPGPGDWAEAHLCSRPPTRHPRGWWAWEGEERAWSGTGRPVSRFRASHTVRCMPAHNRAEQRFEGLAEDGTACQGERQT